MKVYSMNLVILAVSMVGADAFFRNPCKKKRRDILCKFLNWRCPRDCSTEGILIETLRNIADPLNQITKPDLKLDLDKDGAVTFLDFILLLEKTLEKNSPESLIPGGNLTQFVIDGFTSPPNGREMTMTTSEIDGTTNALAKTNTNGRNLQSTSCAASGEYNGYQRGTSPSDREWRPGQDFTYNPSLTPRWYDYFLHAATMDLAGLTYTSVIVTFFTSFLVLNTVGAYIILELLKDYIEENYIGSEEGIEGFRHYLRNSGRTISVDYMKAVNEDTSIANTYNLEIREAKDAARALRGEADTSFQFYNTKNRQVVSSTVNWKGALGRHTIWSDGTVTYDGDSCSLNVDLTVTIKDLYDFNRDDEFIGTAAKQASNVFGRFTEYGWASPFTTETTTTESETIKLQCCQDTDCGDPTAFDCTCNICVTQCPSTQLSGGQGFSVFAVDLKKTTGTFETFYDMYSIPDALDILYEGSNIYSTGGLVSDSNTVSITYGSNTTTSTTVFVQINAPEDGTAWEVSVSCPP